MAAGDLEPGELGLELAFLRLKFDDVLIYTIDRRRAGQPQRASQSFCRDRGRALQCGPRGR